MGCPVAPPFLWEGARALIPAPFPRPCVQGGLQRFKLRWMPSTPFWRLSNRPCDGTSPMAANCLSSACASAAKADTASHSSSIRILLVRMEMVARGNADKQGCLNFTRVEERQLERGRVPSARACLAALSRRTLCVAPTGAHPRVQLHEPEAVAGRRGQGSGVVCLRQKRFPHHDFQPRPLPGSGASPVGAFRGTASGGGRPMIF